jgi:aminoglycoside/choline kinase family phosphotransferase
VRYVQSHFDGPDLYQAEIDRNMDFLRRAIESAELDRLRRLCYSLSQRSRRAA